MEYQPLITREDIARYKQLSKSGYDDKLKEQILDAQLLDLQPLIGESLYKKITENPQGNASLLDYGTYTHDGIEYINYGLKMVLAYFAYARYVYFGSYIDTAFSMVEKLNDNSRPADALAKKKHLCPKPGGSHAALGQCKKLPYTHCPPRLQAMWAPRPGERISY